MGMPYFKGEITDARTGKVVFETTMMSEEYLVQNLHNKIRKLEYADLENQKVN